MYNKKMAIRKKDFWELNKSLLVANDSNLIVQMTEWTDSKSWEFPKARPFYQQPIRISNAFTLQISSCNDFLKCQKNISP